MSWLTEELDDVVGIKLRKAFIAIIVMVVAYVILALVFSFWPFSSFVGVVQKTTSSSAIISNYEWFYDQYNAIEAQKANIRVIAQDAPERVGMQMVLNRAISEYNSRSRQITRNLWKADDLPYQIELGGM